MTEFAVGQKEYKIRRNKKLPGVERVGNTVFPRKPALRPGRVTDWSGDDAEGSAVGKGTFVINSALPFPVSASQLLI